MGREPLGIIFECGWPHDLDAEKRRFFSRGSFSIPQCQPFGFGSGVAVSCVQLCRIWVGKFQCTSHGGHRDVPCINVIRWWLRTRTQFLWQRNVFRFVVPCLWGTEHLCVAVNLNFRMFASFSPIFTHLHDKEMNEPIGLLFMNNLKKRGKRAEMLKDTIIWLLQEVAI